jgi:hypothetical protein
LGKRAGVILGVLVIVLAFIMLPVLLGSFDDISRAPADDSANVTTAATTIGNITLQHILYSHDIDNVDYITSNNTADAPIADSYIQPQLAVEGLDQNANRTLTVYYFTERTDYDIATLSNITPFILFLCLLLSGIALCWRAASSGP